MPIRPSWQCRLGCTSVQFPAIWFLVVMTQVFPCSRQLTSMMGECLAKFIHGRALLAPVFVHRRLGTWLQVASGVSNAAFMTSGGAMRMAPPQVPWFPMGSRDSLVTTTGGGTLRMANSGLLAPRVPWCPKCSRASPLPPSIVVFSWVCHLKTNRLIQMQNFNLGKHGRSCAWPSQPLKKIATMTTAIAMKFNSLI